MIDFASKISSKDLSSIRPKQIRVLIAQGNTTMSNWKEDKGLYYPINLIHFEDWLQNVIIKAKQHLVDLLILPELSVPQEQVRLLQNWSLDTGSIVVAGSHYYKTSKGVISRSPVIIAGNVYFTHKLAPAHGEYSPIEGEGLTEGEEILLFRNTRIGNFAVLICSDYLKPETRRLILSNEIDLICVPAFQEDSAEYYNRMDIDCRESESGVYIMYANMLCADAADGQSACFALMDNSYVSKLQSAGFSDGKPTTKICSLTSSDSNLLVFTLDLEMKRPIIPRVVGRPPNVTKIKMDSHQATSHFKFMQKIGHSDEKYEKIDDFFVKPKEFDSIVQKLIKSKIVFIIGDPGIGKTYTAVKILSEFYSKGYEPAWYTGLEREEREAQRKTLNEFQPKNRQVIYFEDPFGRTSFERREALYQVFNPLIEKLEHLDSLVIVTSRKEVFEQFIRESLSNSELLKFKEEMSIVKPSYSHESLKTILNNLAVNRCDWFDNPDALSLVYRAIQDNLLPTPLSIKHLVNASDHINTESELDTLIQQRRTESARVFAQEFSALSISEKLFLLIIFLWGGKSQSKLVTVHDKLLPEINARFKVSTRTFMEEMRKQLQYRIEQYGSGHTNLRFSHPVYEEAFVEASLKDPIVLDLASIFFDEVLKSQPNEVASSIVRHAVKHTSFSIVLLRILVQGLLKSGASGHQIVKIGDMLISTYARTGNTNFIFLLDLLVEPYQLLKNILESSDKTGLIGSAIHLIVKKASVQGVNPKAFSEVLDWNAIKIKLYSGSFHIDNIVYVLESASEIRPSFPDEFFSGENVISLHKKFGEISESSWSFLEKITCDNQLKTELKKWTQADKSRKDLSYLRKNYEFAGRWGNLASELSRKATQGVGLVVDKGAIKAMKDRPSVNLLPVGILSVIGDFSEGEVVHLFDIDRKRIGMGLVEYSSSEIQDIKGQHSGLIPQIIGRYHGPAAIRRGAWVLLGD
ncbi:hypothetical protein COW64_21605 [bacterium (Candidatus Blackallbacteria) CG18_big_fil_WC_8_21_14_2_50_49_26]|nr:MAG: hypothetical protein COW64_21605 [bacterium (Candidatus Blackallbacteria) CG18_big_fil_WC_8_21_14_2_50_49_26]